VNAIVVSVDCHDFLEVTLPWNAGHFDQVLVVTTEEDRKTQRIVKRVKNALYLTTNAFYRNGAEFNKGLAIEEAIAETFEFCTRDDWVCHLDGDVLLPKEADLTRELSPGYLYLAQRRFCEDVREWAGETEWEQWPVSSEMLFVSGFLQVFHGHENFYKGEARRDRV